MKIISRCTDKSIIILVQVVINKFLLHAEQRLLFCIFHIPLNLLDNMICIKNILHNSCFFINSSIFILSWIYLHFWKSIMYSCGKLVLKCFVGVTIFMYDVVYSVFVFHVFVVYYTSITSNDDSGRTIVVRWRKTWTRWRIIF